MSEAEPDSGYTGVPIDAPRAEVEIIERETTNVLGIQEQVLRTWDGIRFEDEPVPEPGPTAPDPEPEPGDGDVYHIGIDLIMKYNKHAVETSINCPHCKKSNLIYFINHWTNTRKYKERRYALTELLCIKCGSGRIHGLFERNDIEYYYLGIKDD